jgi:Glycosyltransferase like family 2
VLARLSADLPRLRVIALPRNGGAIAALNCGLAAARGTYVYFGASDDVTKPGLFTALLQMTERYPQAAFACAEAEVVDMDTGRVDRRPPVRPAHLARHFSRSEVAALFRRIDNWILTGAALVRRDLLIAAGGLDGRLGALADGYALRRLALQHGCCFVPVMGLTWRIRAAGLSRSQAADPTAMLETLETALAMMRSDAAFPAWYPALFERRLRFAVARLAVHSQPMNRAVLQRIGARGPAGRLVLAMAAALGGPAGRVMALGWLSLRERPTSLRGLLTTWLARLTS